MTDAVLHFAKTNEIISWASQDIVLQQLWLEGEQVDQIAARLGRTDSAVLTRAARIGLPRRAAPGRKASKKEICSKAPSIIGFVPTERVRKVVSSNQNQSVKKPLIVYQSRTCLCCGGSFPSEGTHNRICGKCKESQRYRNAS